jgi:hypothetical protein
MLNREPAKELRIQERARVTNARPAWPASSGKICIVSGPDKDDAGEIDQEKVRGHPVAAFLALANCHSEFEHDLPNNREGEDE